MNIRGCRKRSKYGEEESLINSRRIELGYTLNDIHEATGININTFFRLVHGEDSPFCENGKNKNQIKPCVESVCKFLDISVEKAFPRYFCSIAKIEENEFKIELEEDNVYINEELYLPSYVLDNREIPEIENPYEYIVDYIFNNISMTSKQKFILIAFLKGYNETEIVEMCDVSRQAINECKNNLFKKIRKHMVENNVYESFKELL